MNLNIVIETVTDTTCLLYVVVLNHYNEMCSCHSLLSSIWSGLLVLTYNELINLSTGRNMAEQKEGDINY